MDEGGNERTQLYVLRDDGSLEALVVDPRFIHRTPHAAGRTLAYATNRGNGVDFAVVARDLETGEERTFELDGYLSVATVSPDGRFVIAERTGARSGDNDLYLCNVATGTVEHLTPHEEAAEFYAPFWHGGRVMFASNDGRDTFALVAGGEVVHESRWDAAGAADDAGRRLLVLENADGYSLLVARRRGGPATGARSGRASRLLPRRLAPRVCALDAGRAARRVPLRRSTR